MMSNDERQGVMPDPNPIIDCADCGDGYRFESYWEERYVENPDVNEHEVTWRCDECQRVVDRMESNHSLERFSTEAER